MVDTWMLELRYMEEINLTRAEMNTFLTEMENCIAVLKKDAAKLQNIISGKVQVQKANLVRRRYQTWITLLFAINSLLHLTAIV